jgi:DNA-directed RNA polymerase subunit M/transcription elongation factor TFIIS
MHTGPVPGTFTEEPKPSDAACRKCGKQAVTRTTWDSSCGGYTDYRYDCTACGHRWWIEGADA